jgi:hypothetical protein
MDEMESLQFLMLFLCGIAGMLVAGTGTIIYLLYRTEKRTHVPKVHRPVHGLGVLIHRR